MHKNPRSNHNKQKKIKLVVHTVVINENWQMHECATANITKYITARDWGNSGQLTTKSSQLTTKGSQLNYFV